MANRIQLNAKSMVDIESALRIKSKRDRPDHTFVDFSREGGVMCARGDVVGGAVPPPSIPVVDQIPCVIQFFTIFDCTKCDIIDLISNK